MAAVAVQSAGDELVGDDGGVVGAFHGAFDDLAVVEQSGGNAGDGEIAVVGEEEAELDVRGEVVEDHLAVGGFPSIRFCAALPLGARCKVVVHFHQRPPTGCDD